MEKAIGDLKSENDDMGQLCKKIMEFFPQSKYPVDGGHSPDINVSSLLEELPCFEYYDFKIEDHKLPEDVACVSIFVRMAAF